jgi:hypothetical protein
MLRNLEALTTWNPLGLFRPVMGQLYLLILHMYEICRYVKRLPLYKFFILSSVDTLAVVIIFLHDGHVYT